MIRKALLSGLLASLAVTPAFAGEGPSREETTGVGVGAVVGAVVGGPVGFLVGAAVGAKLGDEFNERNERVDALENSLQAANTNARSLQRDVAALNQEIRAQQGEIGRLEEAGKVAELMQEGIVLDLLFRTAEDQLPAPVGAKLAALADNVATNPDIRINLDGYADERGDEAYNQDLSARRVEHVREALINAGIPESRIAVAAHGESPATEQSADSFALERRVSLTLYVGDTPELAARTSAATN